MLVLTYRVRDEIAGEVAVLHRAALSPFVYRWFPWAIGVMIGCAHPTAPPSKSRTEPIDAVAPVPAPSIPEVIAIPDSVFAQALTRLGFPVTNGRMLRSTALSITQFAISGAYGPSGYRPPEGGPYTGTPSGSYIESTEGLQHFLNLRTFRLENQKIRTIDLRSLTELTFVSLWQNPLTTLDVSKNVRLTTLGVSETSLQQIDLSTLVNLKELAAQQSEGMRLPYVTGNGTTVYGFARLDLTHNTNIERLYITNNALTDAALVLPANRGLQEFWASHNQFRRLEFSYYARLTHVIVEHNDLEWLDLRYSTATNDGVPARLYTMHNPRLAEIRTNNPAALLARAALSNGGVFVDPWTQFVP